LNSFLNQRVLELFFIMQNADSETKVAYFTGKENIAVSLSIDKS
jgi:hypothetical protein